MSVLDSRQKALATELFRVGTVSIITKTEPLKIFSVKVNPQPLRSEMEAKRLVVDAYRRLLGRSGRIFDRLAALSGVMHPVVASLSNVTGIPFLSPRPSRVKGDFKPGMRVACIDSTLVSTGSKLIRLLAMQTAGLVCTDFFGLIDLRQPDQSQAQEQRLVGSGCRSCYHLTLFDLLDFGVQTGAVPQADYVGLVEQLAPPPKKDVNVARRKKPEGQ